MEVVAVTELNDYRQIIEVVRLTLLRQTSLVSRNFLERFHVQVIKKFALADTAIVFLFGVFVMLG